MPFHPMPFDSVRRFRFNELLPQLGILDRLSIGRTPSIPLPIVDPPSDPIAHVDAVRMELHSAGTLECLKPSNRGDQLHAIVRRQQFATRKLALCPAVSKKRSPATRSRISPAGSVREDFDQREFVHLGDELARKLEGDTLWIMVELLFFDCESLGKCIDHAAD